MKRRHCRNLWLPTIIYAVFGAATANMYRVMNNLTSIEWGMDKDIDYNVELHATNGRELKSK